MTNAELIAALRWCPSHSCGRCVALDANGRCTLCGVVGLMNQAADELEAADKRIAELEKQDSVEMHKKQIARIAELEARLPKWISVEDRLPQPMELVLVARKDGFVSLGYCFQFGENHLWSAIRLVPFSPYELPFVGAGHITHWMPLPDAPEGEQERALLCEWRCRQGVRIVRWQTMIRGSAKRQKITFRCSANRHGVPSSENCPNRKQMISHRMLIGNL